MKKLVRQSQNLWRAGGGRWRPVLVAGGGDGGVLSLVDRRSLQAAIFASARIDRLLLAFFFGRVQCLCLMGTTGVNRCAQCSESLL